MILPAIILGHAALSFYWQHQWTKLRSEAAARRLAQLSQEIHDQNYTDQVLREAVEAVYRVEP